MARYRCTTSNTQSTKKTVLCLTIKFINHKRLDHLHSNVQCNMDQRVVNNSGLRNK
jgi:hypothetical protein